MEVRDGGLDRAEVRALIEHHLALARIGLPPENAHGIGAEGLAAPGVTFVTAWEGDKLAGMAALREIDGTHAELKSMRTHPDFLRRGVARLLLDHLLALARARGYAHVSLETGTASRFDPANAMYEAAGFVDVPPFGGYPPSPHNRFMTLALTA